MFWRNKTEKNKSNRKPYLLIAFPDFSALQTPLPFWTSVASFDDNFGSSKFSNNHKFYYLDTIFKKTI